MDGMIALLCLVWGIVCGIAAIAAGDKDDWVSAICLVITSLILFTVVLTITP